MLDRLRTPFFLVALVLILFTVAIEIGSAGKLQQASPAATSLNTATPGKGIESLAFLDGLLLYTSLLMGLSLLVPERVQSKVQGIVSLVISLLLILGGVLMLIAVFVLLILMVTLLLAPIFGTIAYFTLFGFFNTGGARVTLGMVMTLKLAFAVCLVLAHQRFLKNTSLMLLLATSLVATFVLEFLHALVPGPLVSITDAIGAIIALVLALIWALLMLVSSVVSVARAVT
ncbi:MAG TPA: hypothetical protein VLY24_12530 [Bryobacteraceae bacterium]|nr:hypothetical protein [Bryobacteraceae bacterium]